jgi:4-hydroxy-2-oxoheptanedioate aldolase
MTRCDSSMSFWENQNAQAAIIIQTESLEGIINLDAILTEVREHIDSVWLGSLDLRVSMGLSGFWGEEPEWLDAINMFRATLRKHNMPYSGMATGDTDWLKQRGNGRSLMFTCSDVDAIMRISEELRTARSLFPGKDLSTSAVANGFSHVLAMEQVSTP